MTDREQDREAFEKWARDHGYPLRPSVLKHYPIRPIGHAGQEREYGAWDTDAAWQAWQACAAAKDARIEELERAMKAADSLMRKAHEDHCACEQARAATQAELAAVREERDLLLQWARTVMSIPSMTDEELAQLKANCEAAIDAERAARKETE